MELTTYERFRRMYAHKEADRIPIMDSPWPETLDRWQAEGMPTRDYVAALDLDKTAYISPNNTPMLPIEVLEENEEYIVVKNEYGTTTRTFKHRTTTPQDLAFTVTSPEAWKPIKERMQSCDARIPWAMLQKEYKHWREEGRWITGGMWFGFDVVQSRMVGTENLLIAMYEQPEWVMDMFETGLNLSLRNLEAIWNAGYTFDELHWYDDMGYKGTMFFSLDMYRELLKPFHQKAIDWGHAHGCVVRLHSCGNIMPLVPELVDMGLDALNPMERKAGMDPFAIKRDFGDKLVLHGGVNAANFDKPALVEEEIRDLVPRLKENGGYIFASDHSIPPLISYKDFAHMIALVKELGRY